MLSKVDSVHFLGLQSFKVDVEVDIVAGVPAFNIVGLPDTAIKESRERVRSAITNSEFDFPMRKITVNLAPADLKKEGPAFDLPIAISILKATKQIKKPLNDFTFAGELSLTGTVRPIIGSLLLAEEAKKNGKKYFLLPEANAKEAALITGIEIIPVKDLNQAVDFIAGSKPIEPYLLQGIAGTQGYFGLDFSEVKGQAAAKRALEIAAAGSHNLLMVGSPGSGKSMLAKRLPTIMPLMSKEQVIEATKIYSVAGLTSNGSSVITSRPFRSPHHTISSAGLVGGGSYPKPGEISLSHRGVLFLDELPEFNRDVLEALRQPLEEGTVSIARVQRQHTYPADFSLVAAMNPCRCGYYGDKVKHCNCTPNEVRRYKQKISGPLLERIDIHVNVERLTKDELLGQRPSEASLLIKERVLTASRIQGERFSSESINNNSQMKAAHLKKYCRLDSQSIDFLAQAVDKLGLSGRSYDKILRVSRTIADLDEEASIKIKHLAEAIQYRQLDRSHYYA